MMRIRIGILSVAIGTTLFDIAIIGSWQGIKAIHAMVGVMGFTLLMAGYAILSEPPTTTPYKEQGK